MLNKREITEIDYLYEKYYIELLEFVLPHINVNTKQIARRYGSFTYGVNYVQKINRFPSVHNSNRPSVIKQ